jgi:hypothetical protein
MSKVMIFYAGKDCPYRFRAHKDFVPSASEIETQYVQVADFETGDCPTPDDIFADMNIEPEKFFDLSSYEKGVQHTSMSVGDIVIIDRTGHVCLPRGWHEFPVG